MRYQGIDCCCYYLKDTAPHPTNGLYGAECRTTNQILHKKRGSGQNIHIHNMQQSGTAGSRRSGWLLVDANTYCKEHNFTSKI